jgi:hypothetical protein
MSTEAQFKKAAEIVQSLPRDGPVKPNQDDQLNVSVSKSLSVCSRSEPRSPPHSSTSFTSKPPSVMLTYLNLDCSTLLAKLNGIHISMFILFYLLRLLFFQERLEQCERNV